ncbi:MAG: hypothetical protein HY329_21080 [Chloroflexi bacterium]|nr:hypothetical protein [Chloroflexota bacterium]
MFSNLLKIKPTLEYVPDLAKEVPTQANGGISADGLTYTFKLREGVKWHDGKPFTSADVKFTWERIMDPKVNVPTRQGFDQIQSIETPDASTVVMKLKNVYAPFLSPKETRAIEPGRCSPSRFRPTCAVSAPSRTSTIWSSPRPVSRSSIRCRSSCGSCKQPGPCQSAPQELLWRRLTPGEGHRWGNTPPVPISAWFPTGARANGRAARPASSPARPGGGSPCSRGPDCDPGRPRRRSRSSRVGGRRERVALDHSTRRTLSEERRARPVARGRGSSARSASRSSPLYRP